MRAPELLRTTVNPSNTINRALFIAWLIALQFLNLTSQATAQSGVRVVETASITYAKKATITLPVPAGLQGKQVAFIYNGKDGGYSCRDSETLYLTREFIFDNGATTNADINTVMRISGNSVTLSITLCNEKVIGKSFYVTWDTSNYIEKDDPPPPFDATAPNTIAATQAYTTVTIEGSKTPPTVTIIPGTSPVTEGTAAIFTLTADPVPTADLMVNLTIGQTGDFAASDVTGVQQVAISASGTATHKVATVNDNVNEDNGAITATINGVSHYKVGTPSTATVTVEDDDATPEVSFSSSSSSVSEDVGTHNVQVNLSSAPQSGITVSYTLGGTAIRNTDYTTNGSVSVSPGATSVNIPVVITDDSADENGETIILTLSSGTGYTVSSANVHTLTINDNDETTPPPSIPEVSFSSSSSSVSEDVGTHNVQVNLSPAPQSGITVSYTLGGTAIRNTDYTTTGSVSVSPGANSVNIPVVITDDSADENGETIILTLSSGTGYTVSSANVHTLTINDNDETTPPPSIPEVSFSSSSSSVSEDVGTHNVQVNLSPAPQSGITVSYTLGGTAIRNTDYTTNGSVSVSPGATSVNIPVVITDDSADENGETIILTLSSGTGYTVGSANVHTLTINDNDETTPPPSIPEVSFSSSSSSVSEDVGTHNVQVNLSPAPQ